MERKPNTQECTSFGRKMSCIDASSVEVVTGGYVVFGSDGDDRICAGGKQVYNNATGGYAVREMVKERVKVTVFPEDDNLPIVEIDLEDILKFAVGHCRGIYERVWSERNK